MTKPFDNGSNHVIIDKGKWQEFPTEQEADEFYNEEKDNND